MADALSIDVFNGGYKAIPGGPGWDDRFPATWPATTSTLITANGDALLVDALLPKDEGERLAAWVQKSGKRPRAIFVTHGHADHFFGAGPVLDAFPDAALLASDQQVVDAARGQLSAKAMASWNSRFPGQLPQSPPVPELAGSPEFDLDGHTIVFRTIGGADGALATVVHVPELRTICSGDIVYNNIHMWLWNSTPDSRKTWLASLDAVAALRPSTIITGHNHIPCPTPGRRSSPCEHPGLQQLAQHERDRRAARPDDDAAEALGMGRGGEQRRGGPDVRRDDVGPTEVGFHDELGQERSDRPR
jgi:glyoxylase-like metal-dependent hydrolase (beta-lactamase superfamily II)